MVDFYAPDDITRIKKLHENVHCVVREIIDGDTNKEPMILVTEAV